jgi:hypothetical protein
MHATKEVEGANFGDRRLSKRLVQLVERLVANPTASFPEAAGSDAALEATYRFFGNPAVSPQRILAPHARATLERIKAERLVVVPHDTTEFSFSTPREGLGRINDAGQGFFAHVALALSADGARRPLGVLAVNTFARLEPPKREKHTEKFAESERESFRWQRQVAEVEMMLPPSAQAIHVMDSEADSYDLLANLVQEGRRFVIRLKHDRGVRNEEEERVRLSEILPELKGWFKREVPLSARNAPHHEKRGRKRNGGRTTRLATLEFSATTITLVAPASATGKEDLELNLVSVNEIDAPAGTEPVSWLLVTTEPISSILDLELIVDFYRARWPIEELFKALKTGCAFEERQLESLPALLNALAVFVPIAVELLALRTAARTEPERPASALLRPTQILVLERHKTTQLAKNATARAALLAIARLGGHIPNNGEPGWIVLGRGYQKLLELEEGARLVLAGASSACVKT